MTFVKLRSASSGRPKYWCFECRATVLIHKCTKHGCEPVFRHSNKLRVPKYKNKSRFRQFVESVHIFFNCVTDEQVHYLDDLAKDLKLTGKTINGRVL